MADEDDLLVFTGYIDAVYSVNNHTMLTQLFGDQLELALVQLVLNFIGIDATSPYLHEVTCNQYSFCTCTWSGELN